MAARSNFLVPLANIANPTFAIQRQLFARSERVKGIDFHPTEPWVRYFYVSR